MEYQTREENPFEDKVVAEEWIQSIESELNGSRDREIYPMLKEWSHNLSPGILVEIGSGQGICSSKVEINGRYVGIEPSAVLVDRAKNLYKGQNKEFLIGNAYEIPLENSVATGSFSVGVWFHLKDLDKAHNEVGRILKSGAKLLIVTANPNMYGLWEKWYEDPIKDGNKIEGRVQVPTGSLSKNIFYLHTEQEFLSSLERNGFQIDSLKRFGYGKEGQEVHRDEGIWIAIDATKK